MESNEEFWSRIHQQECELERQLDRDMIPIMLPMTVAAGALAGLLVSSLFLPPLPNAFIGIFMLTAMVVGVAPLVFMMIKYR